MKVTVNIKREIFMKPGDEVILDFGSFRSEAVIIRMVESQDKGVYAVLSNGTYRPLSSYGITWRMKYE